MGRGVCVAIAAAWVAAFSLPAFAGEVSCEGFELGYDGEAKAKTCETRDHSTDDKEYKVKFLDVVDQTFDLWVIYFHTSAGTTIHRSRPITCWRSQTSSPMSRRWVYRGLSRAST